MSFEETELSLQKVNNKNTLQLIDQENNHSEWGQKWLQQSYKDLNKVFIADKNSFPS